MKNVKEIPQLERDLRDFRSGIVEAFHIFKYLEGESAEMPTNISASKDVFLRKYILTVVQDCHLTNKNQDIVLAAFGFLQGYENIGVHERHYEYCKWVGICKDDIEKPLDVHWQKNLHKQMNARENSAINRLYKRLTFKLENNQGVLGYIKDNGKIEEICNKRFPFPYYIQEDGYRKCSIDGRIFYIPLTDNEIRKSLVIQDKQNNAPLPKPVSPEGSQLAEMQVPSIPGWGDNSGGRPSYTLEQVRGGILGDQIVFNSITDSVIGDERYFTGVREDVGVHAGKKNKWMCNYIPVEDGKVYIIRCYIHNNNPNGPYATAKNVKVAIHIPSITAREIPVKGCIESSNASPSQYWSTVVFASRTSTPFRLCYIEGSAWLENNGIAGRHSELCRKFSDTIVTEAANGGALVFYNTLDGSIPGCYKYACYVTIRVRVVFDVYTVEQIRQGVLGNRIIFNSIKDSVIGDERNFVRVRVDSDFDNAESHTWNREEISVEDGAIYLIRLYVSNNSPLGYDAVSENTKVAFNVPTKSDKKIAVHGYIFSDNASSSQYRDSIEFKSDRHFHLKYIYGATLLNNDGIGANGLPLSDEIVTKAASKHGTLIGYDALDGKIPGGDKFTSYVTIKVKAVFDEKEPIF